MSEAYPQIVYEGTSSYKKLADILAETNSRHPMIVCGRHSYQQLPVSRYLAEMLRDVVLFWDFTPNPKEAESERAYELLHNSNCDALIAVGGGSAIDIAKAVKHIAGGVIPLIAMPTTAGTGSEATQFAVIYRNGIKHSLDDRRLLPDYVILDPDVLTFLPPYTRVCAAMDAMCQAIESWWSCRATAKSIALSKEALSKMMPCMEAYLMGDVNTHPKMMKAAHLAGRAIQITRTTAPHAMSYALTSVYGIAHGHAVVLLLPYVWNEMCRMMARENNIVSNDMNADALQDVFKEIARTLFQCDVKGAIENIKEMAERHGMRAPENAVAGDLKKLVQSVNAERLQNHPLRFAETDIFKIYEKALNLEGESKKIQ